jgi:hypothetical protein
MTNLTELVTELAMVANQIYCMFFCIYGVFSYAFFEKRCMQFYKTQAPMKNMKRDACTHLFCMCIICVDDRATAIDHHYISLAIRRHSHQNGICFGVPEHRLNQQLRINEMDVV